MLHTVSRSYRWWNPQTSGEAITGPSCLPCTRRRTGASFSSARWVRAQYVVPGMVGEDPARMALVENDEVIQALATERSGEALRV